MSDKKKDAKKASKPLGKKSMKKTKGGILISGISPTLNFVKIDTQTTTPTITDGTLNFQKW